jgi:uncharacterized repeat protein (TIGR01451 family)
MAGFDQPLWTIPESRSMRVSPKRSDPVDANRCIGSQDPAVCVRRLRAFAASNASKRARRLLVGMLAMLLAIGVALAYRAPGSVTGRATAGGTFVLQGGFNVPLVLAGTNIASDTTLTAFNSLGGPTAGAYSPSIALTTPAIEVEPNLGGCAAVTTTRQTCANRGTMTFTFPRPVRNPRLHFGGLGGNNSISGVVQNAFAARFTINTAANGATPVAATWALVGTPLNLSATANTLFSTTLSGNASCSTPTVPGSPAGCGSVEVSGTITSLVIDVSMDYIRLAGTTAIAATNLDGLMVVVTVDEDYGDAPASYDPTQAASHVIGDAAIGANISADNAATLATTTSPNASAAATADSDDVAWPTLTRNLTTAFNVPLSGISQNGTLCGWVDFDNNGAFATGEGTCQAVASGATSATLNIATPVGAVTGNRIARLRFAYGAALTTATPVGHADSGEVEDAQVLVNPQPSLTLLKTTVGGVGGPFGFALSNTTQATGTVTTAVAGAPTQVDGDTGTAGVQSFTITVPNGAVVIDENSLPAGWSLTGATCSNAASATVGSFSGSTYTLSGAEIAASTAFTCTFTNSRLPILRLQKALPNGRFAAADQFALTIAGTGGPATATTTGAGTTATGVATLNPGALGAVYTFSEAGASGASLANYVTTYACTNALAGGQAPSGSGTSFSLTAVAGDDLTCNFGNLRNALADLSLTKTNTPGVNGEVDQSGDTVVSGTTTQYTLVVTNHGPDAADGAVLADPPPTNLVCTTASCTAAGGATCPAATGAALVAALQGAGATIPILPNGGTITVTLDCTVP